MPVELRKRPPPKETATPAPTAKRGSGSTVKKLADKAKAAVIPKTSKKNDTSASVADPEPAPAPVADESASTTNGDSGKVAVGKTISLDGFGGTVQTHGGKDVTLKQLLDESLAGIVIFTYPKASTPGCKHPSRWLLLDGPPHYFQGPAVFILLSMYIAKERLYR